MAPNASAALGPDDRTVAITGAAGYVGGRVIKQLLEEGVVARILAFDLSPPDATYDDRVIFDRLDVRNPALAARLQGVSALVHLAFVMDPIHDEDEMRDVNVNGTANVFAAAAAGGVSHIVYTSSGTVYGAHPNNDVPLTESSPLRANLDFSYPAHKLECEYLVREFEMEHPEVALTVLRPAIVFGPHVANAWSRFLEGPALIAVEGHQPPMQFVHEDDVADAIVFAIKQRLEGTFNLAPVDHVPWEELVEMTGRTAFTLSEPKARALLERLWKMGLAEAPGGMLAYLMYPWVLDPGKLAAAGFSCRHSARATFAEVAGRAQEQLSLAGRTIPRRHLRRFGAALAVTGASVLALRAGRRTAA